MGVYLAELQGTDFRSFPQLQASFRPGVNALVGPNASGKTNALEMVHYLCLTKPARAMADSFSVAHGREAFTLMGLFLRENGDGLPPTQSRVSLRYARGGVKDLRWNGQGVPTMASHVGRIPLVACYPHSMQLVDDGGELRRRFMNAAIAQYDPDYLLAHARYMDFLSQRNALLRSGGVDPGLLEIIETQLARSAAPLCRARAQYCARLQAPLQRFYAALVPEGMGERVEAQYAGSLADGEDPQEALIRSRETDLRMHFTSVGPHRDSMTFTLEGHSLRRMGSLGQQKCFIVALILAQGAIIAQACGLQPILLLDDAFDRLDRTRSLRLLSLLVNEWGGQVFLTHSASLRGWGCGGFTEYEVTRGGDLRVKDAK